MTMNAKFAGVCKTCGRTFPAGSAIEWERGQGARHADATVCTAAAREPAPAPVHVNLRGVADLLLGAQARGLKYPKARFLAPGGRELRLSLAGPQSRHPGSIQVCVDTEWVGRVQPDGTVAGRLATNEPLIATLRTIAADPAKAAKEYGALMCRCSFCDLGLTDAGSVEVGYGPICAKRWGLPHHPKGTPALSPVAA